jgi:hypothetical protein
LKWDENSATLPLNNLDVIPGTLESTVGGRDLENRRLFHPGAPVNQIEAHALWETLARRFAMNASGVVTIARTEIVPGSVFQMIELAALQRNPDVSVEFV